MDKEIEVVVRVNKRNSKIRFKKVNTEGKGCLSKCPISSICENLINPVEPKNSNEDFCHYCSYDLPQILGISKKEFSEYIPTEEFKSIIFKR